MSILDYQVKLLPSVEKEDWHKLKKSGINLVPLLNKLDRLKKNPYICSSAKSGNLSNYRAMNWKDGYRIVFEIDEESKQVIIISIDKHDEAYRKAERRK